MMAQLTIEQLHSLIDENQDLICIHLKTGHPYQVLGRAIDATNATDGRDMIIYQNEDGAVFVREVGEFVEKFKLEE